MLTSSAGRGVRVGGETTTGGVTLDGVAQAVSVSGSSNSSSALGLDGIVESTGGLLLTGGVFGLQGGVAGQGGVGRRLGEGPLLCAFPPLIGKVGLGVGQANGLDARRRDRDEQRDQHGRQRDRRQLVYQAINHGHRPGTAS